MLNRTSHSRENGYTSLLWPTLCELWVRIIFVVVSLVSPRDKQNGWPGIQKQTQLSICLSFCCVISSCFCFCLLDCFSVLYFSAGHLFVSQFLPSVLCSSCTVFHVSLVDFFPLPSSFCILRWALEQKDITGRLHLDQVQVSRPVHWRSHDWSGCHLGYRPRRRIHLHLPQWIWQVF